MRGVTCLEARAAAIELLLGVRGSWALISCLRQILTKPGISKCFLLLGG